MIAEQSFYSTAGIGVFMGNLVVFRVDSAMMDHAKQVMARLALLLLYRLNLFALARASRSESSSVFNLASYVPSSMTFDFCLSTSIPVLTTSTREVAWPQGNQFLVGDL